MNNEQLENKIKELSDFAIKNKTSISTSLSNLDILVSYRSATLKKDYFKPAYVLVEIIERKKYEIQQSKDCFIFYKCVGDMNETESFIVQDFDTLRGLNRVNHNVTVFINSKESEDQVNKESDILKIALGDFQIKYLT